MGFRQLAFLALSYGAFTLLPLLAQTNTGTIQDVQHVVIFMQENRSFDHYFGSKRGVRGFGDLNALVLPTGNSDLYQPNSTNYVLPFHITQQCLNDVEHHWEEEHAAWDNGWWDRWVPVKGPATMVYYTRAELPFYYWLAEAFTICDEYHCSVLGPTYPNRISLMTGTIDPTGAGGGPITANYIPPGGYTWTTYPERLQAAGISWQVYQQTNGGFNLNALDWFANYKNASPGNPLYDRGIAMVADVVGAFRADVTNGTLPQVSWIIPPYAFSEHPPFAPANGAAFTRQLLNVLASNPAVYGSTVFILTYDEGGGFFDHVPPPVPPPGTTNEFVGGLPIGLGARVPMLIISPWSRGGYTCSEVFDHTSIIRFLETWTGVQEPNISAWRRQVCGDLTSAFNFSAPDTNFPSLPFAPTVGCFPVTPLVPVNQVPPLQESGTNLFRRRPYRSNASSASDCTLGQLAITLTNGGVASTHFAIYPNTYTNGAPRQYDLLPSTALTDSFGLPNGAGGLYDFTCYGPHFFHRRFAGSMTNDCNQLEVTVNADPTSGGLAVTMKNSTTSPVTFDISSKTQPVSWTFTVASGTSSTNVVLTLTNNTGSYDLTASVSSDSSFLRSFADNIDTTTAALPFNPVSVALLSPTNGQIFVTPANVPLSATADSTNGISQVEFFYGSISLGAVTNSPYTLWWSNAPLGQFQLTAVATDNQQGSNSITAIILVSNPPPSVALTDPSDGATFFQGTNITLNALASDANGFITQVEFFADTNSLGVLTNEPFTLLWTNAALGSYDLTALATDNDGATSLSSTVTVNIVIKPLPNLLSAVRLGTNFILSFPTWASVGTLETTSDLSAGSWTPVADTGWTNGDSVVVTIPITTDSAYFRMRQ